MAVRAGRLVPIQKPRPAVVISSVFVMLFTALLVVGHSAGRLTMIQATVLLVAPLGAVAIALRPSWFVLFMVAVPAGLLNFIPSRGLVLLALMTLIAQLLTRGKIYLDARSGMLPIALIVAVAFFYKADVDSAAALIARGFMNNLTFWMLLSLITYNSVRLGELKMRQLMMAILVGAAMTALLEMSGLTTSTFGSEEGVQLAGQRLPHVAVMGFSISLGWLIYVRQKASPEIKAALAVMSAFFLVVAVSGFLRVVWLTAIFFLLLVAQWTRKRRYWIVIPIAIAVFVFVPAVQERVFPRSTEGFDAALITTGRTELWGILWEDEVTPALPFGNGWGHTFSLDAQRVFGFESFESEQNLFVFPHNDFIFWMVELGLVGAFALLALWLYLLSVCRRLARSPDHELRAAPYIFAGVFLMEFLIQLIDNGFGIAAVAVPFYVCAGFIFGLNARARERVAV